MNFVPAQRLTDVDLYHFIDWVEQGWDDDEITVTRRLFRLKHHLELLTQPHRDRALDIYQRLWDSRLHADEAGGRVRRCQTTVVELRAVVADWKRAKAA